MLLSEIENTQGEMVDPEVYYDQGRIYFSRKNYDLAINKFSQVIKHIPNHSNALYSMGLALEELGEKEEALKYFKKVLELNPNNEEIEKQIQSLE